MNIGHRHPDASRFEWEYASRRELGVYLSVYWRHWDLLRVHVGPGVIPF